MDGQPTRRLAMFLLLMSCVLLTATVFGSEFSIGLLGLDDPTAIYKLVFTNPGTEDSTVTISDSNHDPEDVNVPANAAIEYPLAAEYALNASDLSNKTIHINSTKPVRVQVFSELNNHVEGFTAIPKDELTGPRMVNGVYEYFTTTFCATSGYCQFAISAFEEGAKVKVDFPPDAEEIVFCKGVGSYRSNTDKTIEIDKDTTVHFESASDLTGVRIYSYKPISVFVGSRNISNDATVGTHMIEQLHPTANWGKRYVVRTLGSNGYGDILSIRTQLPNTTLDIQGFPTFVVSKWNDNIWRRLDKGMVSYVVASHPIQIVQITGLAYASASDVMAASMTVVPAIENGANSFPVSCGTGNEATVNVVSEYLHKSVTVVGSTNYDNEYTINGEDYMTGSINASSNDVHVVENPDAPINGIVTCKTTATMPLGLVHVNETGTTGTPSSTPNPVCKEMLSVASKITTTFDPAVEIQSPHQVQLDGYKIIILRFQTCGDFTLQFMSETGDYVVITISKISVYAYGCTATGCDSQVELDLSGYTPSEFGCQKDVAIFWFRVTDAIVEFGPGPFPKRLTAVPPTLGNVSIPNSAGPTKVSMFAVPAEADFSYDLETEEDCFVHESDWRCQDKTNCDVYGQRICTDHQDFARSHCVKYCKFCTPDSYGRKFLVLRPLTWVGGDKKCKLVVTGYSGVPNVAVGSQTRLLVVENEVDRSKVYDYPCGQTKQEAIVVYSDIDVTVMVVYDMESMATQNEENQIVQTSSYMVYPVDTFGTKYLSFMNSKFLGCVIGAEYSTVNVIPYFTEGVFSDRVPTAIGYFDIIEDKEDETKPPKVRHFKSEKPFTMVCGDRMSLLSHEQILPTAAWGTKYVVPKFEDNPNDLPFELKLFFMASRKNTAVYIDGDFNAVHIIDNEIGTKEQIITGAESYMVTANNPIGLAVIFTDKTNEISGSKVGSFHQLPPNNTFHSYQVIALPSKLLEDFNQFNQPVSEIKTYSITPSGQSTKTNHTGINNYIVSDFSAVEQFSLSVATSNQGKWFSVSGPQMFTNYDDTELCHTSTGSIGDSIDNDCDGLADEDTYYSGYAVYSEDFDLDGNFKDDSCCVDTTAALIGKPTDPTCLEILKPTNHCMMECTCNCAWLSKLEQYNQLTESEKESLHATVAEQQKSELSVDQSQLSSTTAQKQSAEDDRQSAVGIGYLGIALFTIVFGMIFIMDVTSLVRDARILGGNLKEGCTRLLSCVKGTPSPD